MMPLDLTNDGFGIGMYVHIRNWALWSCQKHYNSPIYRLYQKMTWIVVPFLLDKGGKTQNPKDITSNIQQLLWPKSSLKQQFDQKSIINK